VKLLFATTNRGKLAELAALVGPGLEVVSPADLGSLPEVVEDADTFSKNALKKARELGTATGLAALADDSGLCVDALGGRPGVHSARYDTDEAKRIARLLRELDGVPLEKRTARFRCALALWLPDGPTVVEEGICEGRIGFSPRGSHGFGYDPIFEVAPQWKTLAELTITEKAAISHRGRAFELMRPRLKVLSGA
jgi:XTP/dITP diphosphohydrolase